MNRLKKRLLRNTKSEGYTFVETLAVLAIGAVMTAGTTISASKVIAGARKASAKNQIEQFSAALQSYFLDCGCFPTTEQGLIALWEKPSIYPVPEEWSGPYVEKKPSMDPWGSSYLYITNDNSNFPSEVSRNIPFVIISYGADKRDGGEGLNADLKSWE